MDFGFWVFWVLVFRFGFKQKAITPGATMSIEFLTSEFYKDAAKYASSAGSNETRVGQISKEVGFNTIGDNAKGPVDPKLLIDPNIHRFVNASLSSSHAVNTWRTNIMTNIIYIIGISLIVIFVYWMRSSARQSARSSNFDGNVNYRAHATQPQPQYSEHSRSAKNIHDRIIIAQKEQHEAKTKMYMADNNYY